MRAYAMIPARSGSKGLPGKNVSRLAGVPLVSHAVNFAAKLPVDRIYLSSDAIEYYDAALAGCEAVPENLSFHRRGAAASGDAAMEESVVADFVAQGLEPPDVWVWLKPTSPFRRVSSVERALLFLRDMPHVDSVRVVSDADARLHEIDARGWLAPSSADWPLSRSKIRRSELPRAYKPFNLEVFRHSLWRGLGSAFMGDRILPILDRKVTGLDVDDREDLDIAEAVASLRPRPTWLEEYVHD